MPATASSGGRRTAGAAKNFTREDLDLARDLSAVPAEQRHAREAEERDMPTRWVDLEDAVEAVLGDHQGERAARDRVGDAVPDAGGGVGVDFLKLPVQALGAFLRQQRFIPGQHSFILGSAAQCQPLGEGAQVEPRAPHQYGQASP